jgi:hypothetical protein
MRLSQILLPVAIAFAAAACARQQASYYVIDPATQRPVQVAQQATPAPYPQPQYAPAGYQQPPAQRGLFSSAQTQAYAQASYQQPPAQNGRGLFSSAPSPVYGQAPYPPPYQQPAALQQQPSGRGLFSTFAATPAYGQQAYAAAAPIYGQQVYAAPPPVAAYGGQPAPPQYRPPAYGPYAAAPQANPFAQARWY